MLKRFKMQTITIYQEVETEIRKGLNQEETKQDKEYYLKELNRLIGELMRSQDIEI